jgi:hypothetical protein
LHTAKAYLPISEGGVYPASRGEIAWSQCLLSWDAAVASGYRLLGAHLYAVPSPLPVLANSIEEWNKLLRGAITLDASWYWAPQKPAYNPNF